MTVTATGTNLVFAKLFWQWWSFWTIYYPTWPYITNCKVILIVNFYDGHWDQFGTTVDHAIEIQSDFHNDGHWDQLSTHTMTKI